jgi:hypothetical protein
MKEGEAKNHKRIANQVRELNHEVKVQKVASKSVFISVNPWLD